MRCGPSTLIGRDYAAVQIDREQCAIDAGRVVTRTELRGRQVVLGVEDRFLPSKALYSEHELYWLHCSVMTPSATFIMSFHETLTAGVVQVLRDPSHPESVHVVRGVVRYASSSAWVIGESRGAFVVVEGLIEVGLDGVESFGGALLAQDALPRSPRPTAR